LEPRSYRIVRKLPGETVNNANPGCFIGKAETMVARRLPLLIVCWGVSAVTPVGAGEVGRLDEDATLLAWGSNGNGQCNVPAGDFTQVAAGWYHSLALESDGSLAAWGRNDYGECNVPAGNFTQVAAGAVHSLALESDGSLAAWGQNDYGECNVPAGNFTQVAAGAVHSLALKSDGSLAAWGDNFLGQCNVPAGNFTQVAAGGLHSLALKSDGSLAAWGYNGSGQCNVPTTGYFIDVAAGTDHSLGLKYRDDYDDLLVTGSGPSALLQRSVDVAGDAVIESMMDVQNNATMTVGGRTTILPTGGIRGAGTIAGEVRAEYGSRIIATGDLTLGDETQFGALLLDGELRVDDGRLTLNDRTALQLGRLTVIDGGTLASANGLLVAPGMTLAGMGSVDGRLINQGLVAAGAPGEDLTFNDLVSGAGSFTGSLIFNGGFSPGNSPTVQHLDWATFTENNTLTMELGGLLAGYDYDHLIANESLTFGGTLNVELLAGFIPTAGDLFDLFDGTLLGQFDAINLPTLAGVTWDTSALYTTGTLLATPEPSTLAMLVGMLAGLFLWSRRHATCGPG
jgi:hypothetical protein